MLIYVAKEGEKIALFITAICAVKFIMANGWNWQLTKTREVVTIGEWNRRLLIKELQQMGELTCVVTGKKLVITAMKTNTGLLV